MRGPTSQGDALGFGPVRTDDELLDRLAAREAVDVDDDLLGLLQAWTGAIDADEAALAPAAGLFSTGPRVLAADGGTSDAAVVAAESPAGPRTVRIRGSRAAAVAAVAVATMSFGGMAAAMTGRDVPIVSHIVAAARPIVAAAVPLPSGTGSTPAQHQGAPDELVTTMNKLVSAEIASQDYEGAKRVLDAIPPSALTDPSVRAQYDQWWAQVARLATSEPTVAPGTATGSDGATMTPPSATTDDDASQAPSTGGSKSDPPKSDPPRTDPPRTSEPTRSAPSSRPSTPDSQPRPPKSEPPMPTHGQTSLPGPQVTADDPIDPSELTPSSDGSVSNRSRSTERTGGSAATTASVARAATPRP